MSKKVKGPHEDLTYRTIGRRWPYTEESGRVRKRRSINVRWKQSSKRPACLLRPRRTCRSTKVFGAGDGVSEPYGATRRPVDNFGGRSLRWRRVFPSPQATEFRYNYRWMFVPGWLKAQRQEGSSDKARQSVPPCDQSVSSGCAARTKSGTGSAEPGVPSWRTMRH